MVPSRRSLMILLFACVAALSSGCATKEKNPDLEEDVALTTLLKAGARYDGQKVAVTGYLVPERDSYLLFTDLSDSALKNYRRSLWMAFSDFDFSQANLDRKKVIVHGRYHVAGEGHVDLWPGSIEVLYVDVLK